MHLSLLKSLFSGHLNGYMYGDISCKMFKKGEIYVEFDHLRNGETPES